MRAEMNLAGSTGHEVKEELLQGEVCLVREEEINKRKKMLRSGGLKKGAGRNSRHAPPLENDALVVEP